MSRIGKLPIHIPQGVTVAVSPDNTVTVKGPKGQLSQQVSADLTVTVEENEVHVARHTEDKEHKAQHGLYRALLHNMVVGVSTLDGEQELPVRKLLHRTQDGSCLAELPSFNIAQLRLSYRELEQLAAKKGWALQKL